MAVPEIRWMRSDLKPGARRKALAMLSDAELARYDAAPTDGFLAGRLVLRRLAAELTETAPADVDLRAVCLDCGESHGKPVIEGSDLHVSLSHAPALVVAAAHWGAHVGIDVELSDQPDTRLDAIKTLTGDRSVRTWTRVEAVLKADGRGLRVDPSEVRLDADTATLGGVTYLLSEVEVTPELLVSVAVAA